MKPRAFLRLLPVVPLCAAHLFALPDSAIPQAAPANRYAALAAKSMFAPAAAVATIQPKPSFAADLFVVGLAQFGEKDFVMIINRRTRDKFSLVTGGEKGPDDVELSSVRWAANPAQSAVTVRRGLDSSVLEFDEAAFQKPAAPAPSSLNVPPIQYQVPPMPVVPPMPNAQGQYMTAPPTHRDIIRRLRVPHNQ